MKPYSKYAGIALTIMAIVLAFPFSSIAFADVETSLTSSSGKATAITIEDYVNDGNAIVPSFVGEDGSELPVSLERIDPLDEGNIAVFRNEKVPMYGLVAYTAKVVAPRSSTVKMRVDNFVPEVDFRTAVPSEIDDVHQSEYFVDPDTGLGINDHVAVQSQFKYLYGTGDVAYPPYLEALDSKSFYSLMYTELLSEEFFNDNYTFKLNVDDRTCFDKSYVFQIPSKFSCLEKAMNEYGSNFSSIFSFNRVWNMYIFFTYAEDKDAADKIAALPEADGVTLESAEQIAAARAAYDLLAQWEGAQDAIDATKLVDAEAKLAELQKAAAATELEQAIAEAEKVDTSKLTDEQKKALQDAIDAAKDALANGELAADAIAAAKDAVAGATTTAQTQVAEAIKAAEEAAAKTELKANPMTATAKTVKAKGKKKTVIKKAKAFVIKGAQGKVTFKKMSGNKKIKVSKAGKVTVKKGLKKGKTYKVKVLVSAAGNAQYKPMAKTVTLKVKIK